MKSIIFRKRSVRHIAILFICAALSLTIISVVLGRPFRLKKLPDKGKNFGCKTCHVNPKGGKKKNTFGQDYEKIALKAGDKYTDALGKMDSDGDGVVNDHEFDAKTNPGDAESKPAGVEPETEEGADSKIELLKVMKKGKALFNNVKLGKAGTSCNSCHPGGDTAGGQVMDMEIPTLKGAAATFPKYKKPAKRVITLSQMNNMCIKMIMEGKPLKLDSDEAVALTTYVTSLSNGTKVQVGAK